MAKDSFKKVIALGLDYSDFQGGLKECTEEMKKLDSEHKKLTSEMENAASGSEKLSEQNDYLTKKIELQSRKVEIAKNKLEDLKNSEDATASQINKATIAFNKEATELNNLNNELIQTNISQTNLKQNAAMLVTVITAVGAAALSCVTSVAEYADELKTLSAQTGLSVETLQEWDYASEMIDTDFKTMTSAFQKLEKTMAESPETFRELGVSVTDSTGHMRNAEDVYMQTIDALRSMKNATEQDQMAMAIFGKSATELTGMINAGSRGLKAYGMEAQSLGLILSDEEVDAASQAQDAFDRLTKSLDVAKMKIGAELAPVVTAIANAIAQIPAPVLATIAVIGSLVAVITLAVVTIGSVIKAFGNIASAVGLATGAMNPQLLIILAIIAALALLTIAITKIIELYRQWRQEQEALVKTSKQLTNTLNVGFNAGASAGAKADHKAVGGYSRGGMTWVGENGPELVDLPSGSRVYNNNESKRISNSPTYNISMNLDITKLKSVNDVVEAVKGLGMSSGLGGTV